MPQGYANEIHTSLSLLVPLNIRMNPLATFMYTVITLYFIFARISEYNYIIIWQVPKTVSS